ncbi:hypothetical protein [Nocardiopsis sp. NRRL B-16309]|uniref:hypothetical protein n=1 Tax=Nocardiopsis sp. NRRL B-16309 TaxID=1519494 RepID=UPI0006AFFAA0|nr:hypothetical protein [Nocardiopsis sp. NRRL B-16309]KOX15980.1 hypothetical protein ADL05_13345 [Nocardiopsis sp. NRRL B-16309]
MFRIAISRLSDDGWSVTPERRATALSVDEAISSVREHLPAADTSAVRSDTVQRSVNRVNDFRTDVATADGGRYRVVIAPMM